MSSQTRGFRIHERVLSAPDAQSQRHLDLPDVAALGPYGTLVQKLAQLRQKQPAGVVVTFASVSSGEGVTSVVESVSWELARHAGQAVLVTSPAALAGAQSHFRITEPIDPHKVWRLASTLPGPRQADPVDPRDGLRMIRERFGFILVDCPPLLRSSAIFSAAAISDGFVLVVAAGQTKRTHVEEARRLLAAISVPMLGLVLNKHKSHIPKFLSAVF